MLMKLTTDLDPLPAYVDASKNNIYEYSYE